MQMKWTKMKFGGETDIVAKSELGRGRGGGSGRGRSGRNLVPHSRYDIQGWIVVDPRMYTLFPPECIPPTSCCPRTTTLKNVK